MANNYIKPISQENISGFLLEATPGLGWIAGPDGLCYGFNTRWLKFTGRTLEQEYGNGWAAGVHPEDLQRCLDIYTQHLAAKTPFEMRYRLRHHSGHFHWILDCGQPLFNGDGSFAGFLGSCQDIQASVVETETRENSLRLFQELIESAPDFIGISDLARKSIYHNRSWRGLEPLGKTTEGINVYHPPSSFDKISKEGMPAAIHYGYWRGQTELIVNENGKNEIIPVAQTIIAHKNRQGVTTHFSTLMRDIREERRKEAELVGFNNAVNCTALISLTDISGTILEVNDIFTQVSGYERMELIGQDHRMLNSGYHPKEFFKDLWDTLKAGKVWRGEIQNKKKNGELYWVQSFITPILGPTGVPERYLSIRFDVTPIRALNLKLAQASKMSELGQMSSGIAHEINNPLAIIKGRTSILSRLIRAETHMVNQEAALKAIESIDSTADRIAKIVAGLKSFARDGSNDPFQFYQVRQIIDETISFCWERFRSKSVELKIEPIPDNLFVECRPTQISQVLLNLLNNGFDAISENSDKWLQVQVVDHAHEIEIKITDSGGGIPEHLQKKILEPFFTTKETGKGTGLGLSISAAIIQHHHGSLSINSAHPNTQFVIRLPKKQSPAPNLGHREIF